MADILVARALAHVHSLTERFDRDRARVSARLDALEAACGARGDLSASVPEAFEPLRACLLRGEFNKVARTARRIAVDPSSIHRLVERVARDAELAPGIPSQRPPPFSQRPPAYSQRPPAYSQRPPAGPSQRPPSRAPQKQRAVVYEDSVAALVASFALARAVDVVPEDAGPYNPLRIASSTLDRMREISPFFLTVQLNRLEELASLLALPELPVQVEEKILPKKKTRPSKGGRT